MNKKQKSLTNKGFSLVELIIVIAIMAVLVGVLAPQYIKYLDKSKISADKQLADNLRQAITTTMLDPEITQPTLASSDTAIPTGSSLDAFWTEVYGIMGVSDGAALKTSLKYDTTADILYSVDTDSNVTVTVNYKATGKTTNSFKVDKAGANPNPTSTTTP